jgi:hypothetical protein
MMIALAALSLSVVLGEPVVTVNECEGRYV